MSASEHSNPLLPPFLWLVVGPNGGGKSTYYTRVIAPRLNLPFVNADWIARDRWSQEYAAHAYEAGRVAAQTRERLIEKRRSFVAETVFSHPSKLDLLRTARGAGYVIWMTFVCVATADLSVARVGQRINEGGHPVPPDRVRSRYRNLRANVLQSVSQVDRLMVVDNSDKGAALRDVLLFEHGSPVWRSAKLPEWAGLLFSDYA